ncbi:hypothetical protein BP5796_04056 [Coleophoma crateriformis]|uniref:Uncharacterized protein n=1 Tax=Coleophoma crateriformis TaxID=565419 RepID=A0A3D8SHT6_9HELO|nr:hypothetical protein BP5796_04056 [Coleophoma crateriformis]
MSFALENVARLKPEIRLAQAISEFEADLSSNQKASLHTYRSQIQNVPLAPSEVMRLTAEIDRSASSRNVSRQCFGPRMTNFLYAVQQFASIGDVMVGGSQNLIACGVWAVVRMLLLSIVTMSSYLEKLSSLLMDAGRSAPRYQEIVLVFPRSKPLQSYLAEYFITVVDLCHTVFKLAHKSTVRWFVSTLDDSSLKGYQSDFDRWANLIRDEVNTLVAKRVEKEAQANTHFRALMGKASSSVSLEQKLKTRLRILESCSTYDYETPWKQIRKVGNATLFNQIADYQDWRSQANSSTLFYTGKLGSGKSVLLANIVDDLNLYVQRKDVVTYFFCRYDISESLKARTIIGSLVRQLLRPISELDEAAKVFDDTVLAPDFEYMFKLLEHVIPNAYKAYFILDGLDECDYSERSILIPQLQRLQDRFTLLVCISYRLEPDNALRLKPEEFTTPRSISMSEDNPDIEDFILNELENCLQSSTLVLGDPSLILEIRDALLQHSQGMFLWVALQIKSLCAMKTDESIRQALVDLPKDLTETFLRILARVEIAGQSYQRQILELVTVAQRPLHVNELREALSVVPGNTTWDPATLLNDIYSTLACCGPLVIVDEEELTIRLVHHSVKQFLLTKFNPTTYTGFTIGEAHKTMTSIIVTYLNYGIFGTQLSTIVSPQIMTESVPSGIIRSTLGSSLVVRSLALKFLRSKTPNYDIGQTLIESRKLFKDRLVSDFHFYSYAKSCWQQHMLCTLELEPKISSLLLRLLRNGVVDASTRDDHGDTLLSQAAERGNEVIFALLLETDQFETDLKDIGRWKPLHLASEDGHINIVKLLVEKGADINAADMNGRTLLYRASENGHIDVVKLLLEKGADVNATDKNGWTPLCTASQHRHIDVVKLLLEMGADVNAADENGRTPLYWVSFRGHVNIIKLLLEKEADINTADKRGFTPLHRASQDGKADVVKLLLEKEADVSVADKSRWTPLHRASENGQIDIVKLLLNKGADVNAADENGTTPLYWASFRGHVDIVKLLLERGADVNVADKTGWAPLHWASKNGHVDVVKLLSSRS